MRCVWWKRHWERDTHEQVCYLPRLSVHVAPFVHSIACACGNGVTKLVISVADIRSNIGVVYADTLQYQRAIDYYELALQVYEQGLGEDHSSTGLVFVSVRSAGGFYRSKF